MPKIAAGVLLLAGIGLFTQAVLAVDERGVELGGPTLAPLIVTGLWVAVAAAYALQAFRAEISQITEGVRWWTPLLLLGILIGYACVLKYTVVGYVLATAAFYFGAARLLGKGRERITRDAIVAIGLSVGIYLVFTRLLGIGLPSGVLPL